MLLTVGVSAQQMMGPNIVPCFTISLTCAFSVFPTGVLIGISVPLFNSCKILVCLDHSLSYRFLIDSPLTIV